MKFHFNTKDTCGHCRDLPGFDTADVLNWDQRWAGAARLTTRLTALRPSLHAKWDGSIYLGIICLQVHNVLNIRRGGWRGGEGLFEAEGL